MENILCVKLPYPKIKENKRNLRLVSVINRAYAGGHGELKAILQYAYHYLYFKGMGDEQTARIIMGICVCEMKHLNILGDAIISLGGDPVYATSSPFGYNYFSASKVWYGKTPEKMLIDDLTSEILAVNEYEKMLSEIDDEEVYSIIERLILDEKLHEKVIKEKLIEISGDDFTGLNID
jgi:bacterioferritin